MVDNALMFQNIYWATCCCSKRRQRRYNQLWDRHATGLQEKIGVASGIQQEEQKLSSKTDQILRSHQSENAPTRTNMSQIL